MRRSHRRKLRMAFRSCTSAQQAKMTVRSTLLGEKPDSRGSAIRGASLGNSAAKPRPSNDFAGEFLPQYFSRTLSRWELPYVSSFGVLTAAIFLALVGKPLPHSTMTYVVLKFIHVLSVVVWIVGVTALATVTGRLIAARDRATLAALFPHS